MLERPVRAWVGICAALVLASCAAVDQFGSRVDDANTNSQDALNRETLLNILRASNRQPLNFIAVTQITGGQTETVNTGLPTITIGPAQTVAQHQFQVTNSVSSGVTGGFQSNPLVSTAFQTAMLSPITPREAALLLAAHPREPVFYAVLRQITFRQTAPGGHVYTFTGDTINDTRPDCAELYDATPPEKLIDFRKSCNYTLFINYLEVFVLAGLSVELLPLPPSKAAKPAGGSASGSGDSGSDSKSAPASVGHICFNPTQSSENTPQPRCGVLAVAPDSTKKSEAAPLVSIPGFGEVEVEFGFRSPIGAFNHFGDLLREPSDNMQNYHTIESSQIIREGELYLNITQGASGPCFSAVSYGGFVYCVPAGSMHTAMLFDILIQLRNMSIQTTDLNSAFTVRLTN
jgi:hypothetical protein